MPLIGAVVATFSASLCGQQNVAMRVPKRQGTGRRSLFLLRIFPQKEPEQLFLGLGRSEERNGTVPLMGEVTLLQLNVQL